MRIVAGRLRGRKLAAPASYSIRPTSERTRQSVFNILEARQMIEQMRVIDLFAGTGALGLEALSRGAAYCLFVEQSVEGRSLLRSNIESLDLQGVTRIFRRDATDLGASHAAGKFDLVFADPPYGRGLGVKAAAALVAGGWLKHGAMLVLEESKASLPDRLEGFEPHDQRRFGDTSIGFYVRA